MGSEENPTFRRILESRPLPLPRPTPPPRTSPPIKTSAKHPKPGPEPEPQPNPELDPDKHYDFRGASGMRGGSCSSVAYTFTKVQIPHPTAVSSSKYVDIARDLVRRVKNHEFTYANGETLDPQTVRPFPSAPVNLVHLADREQDAVIIMHRHDVDAGDEIWRLTDPHFGTIQGSFTTEWGVTAAGVEKFPKDEPVKKPKTGAESAEVHGTTGGSTGVAIASTADPAGTATSASHGPDTTASSSAPAPAPVGPDSSANHGPTGAATNPPGLSRHGKGLGASRTSSATASTIASRLHANTPNTAGSQGTTTSRGRSRANTGGSQGAKGTATTGRDGADIAGSSKTRSRANTGGSRGGRERQGSEHSESETLPITENILRQADYYASLSVDELIQRVRESREADQRRKRKREPALPSPWLQCRIDSLYVRRSADGETVGVGTSTSLPWAIPNGKVRPVYGTEAKRPGYVYRFIANIEDWMRDNRTRNPSRQGRRNRGNRCGGYQSTQLLRGSRNLIYQCRGYCIIFRMRGILIYDGLACIFLYFPDMELSETTTAPKLWAQAINPADKQGQGRMEIATMSGDEMVDVEAAIAGHKQQARQNIPLDALPTVPIPEQPEE